MNNNNVYTGNQISSYLFKFENFIIDRNQGFDFTVTEIPFNIYFIEKKLRINQVWY
jgi:hypothetical protein